MYYLAIISLDQPFLPFFLNDIGTVWYLVILNVNIVDHINVNYLVSCQQTTLPLLVVQCFLVTD